MMGRIRAADGKEIDGVNNAGQLMLQVCLMVILPLLPLFFIAAFTLNSLHKFLASTHSSRP